MDVSSALTQFFDDKGNIVLPEQLTLSGMCEMLFTIAQVEENADTPLIRYWDYTQSAAGDVRVLTRAQFNTRAKAVCVRLQQVAQKGDRVAILANNSPEYVYSFFGTLYAGMVPVPLYDPTEPGHAGHLNAVWESSEPRVVLTNGHSAAAVRQHFATVPAKDRPRVLSVEALPDALAQQWVNPMMAILANPELAPSSSETAFLQYTSGSTRTPAGVVLTHKSIITNVLQIFVAGKVKLPMRVVTWLPLHHDMGIIITAFAVILGIPIDLMSPRDFIQNPARWVRQLSVQPEPEWQAAVYTVVPNFALELAARYANPAEHEELSDIDLSAMDGIIVGSEPVHHSSVEKFAEVFGPYGFPTETLRPSYGLAEASLLVTTPHTDNRPHVRWFDREAISEGKAVCLEAGDAKAMPIMSVGEVCLPQVMVVVDPETGKELPEGAVGELWVHGDNVASGYLNREDETTATFRNTLAAADRLAEGSATAGAPEDNWMRTGDLVVVIDGELFITGRLKDLIIVAGRNHYPQDIEATADAAQNQTSPAVIAAFAVPAADGAEGESLVIVAERDLESDPAADAEAIDSIRAAVSSKHGVQPENILIVNPGELPRSSANKIARRVAAKAYLDGAFEA